MAVTSVGSTAVPKSTASGTAPVVAKKKDDGKSNQKLDVKSGFDGAAQKLKAELEKYSCGRGTNDDSIGRGTNDDSIGKKKKDKEYTRSIAGDDPAAGDFNRFILANVSSHLSPAGQGALQALLSGTEKTRQALGHLVGSPKFQHEKAGVQERILKLAAKTGETGTRALAKLMDHKGRVLHEVDTQGATLLENFEKMAQSKDKDVRRTLAATMADIANPARIWQGASPTCTVTAMQIESATHAPAEYARLMAGLALDGKVTMAGGGVLERTATDVSKPALKEQRRTISEALFQDAAMEYANGGEKYDTVLQESVLADGTTHRGLKGEMIREMAKQLSGAKYERYDIPDDATAANVADILAGKSTVKVTSPVLIDLDMGSFNHCVAFDQILKDQVYFRDPETGHREKLSLAEFNQRAVAAYAVVE